MTAQHPHWQCDRGSHGARLGAPLACATAAMRPGGVPCGLQVRAMAAAPTRTLAGRVNTARHAVRRWVMGGSVRRARPASDSDSARSREARDPAVTAMIRVTPRLTKCPVGSSYSRSPGRSSFIRVQVGLCKSLRLSSLAAGLSESLRPARPGLRLRLGLGTGSCGRSCEAPGGTSLWSRDDARHDLDPEGG